MDTSNIKTEEILKKGTKYLVDTIKAKEYDVYHCGWEGDTEFWVLPDGRKFTTNHNSLTEFTPDEFKNYITNLTEYLNKIKDL